MMRKFAAMTIRGWLAATIALIVSAQAAAAGIDVTDAWSRATPPGIKVGVAYLVIANHGQADRLLGAASPVARSAELHVSTMESGMVQMRHLDALDIASGGHAAFAPGGRHIMLIGLKHPLKDGDSFPLTLKFKNAGAVGITVHVYGLGKTPPQSD